MGMGGGMGMGMGMGMGGGGGGPLGPKNARADFLSQSSPG